VVPIAAVLAVVVLPALFSGPPTAVQAQSSSRPTERSPDRTREDDFLLSGTVFTEQGFALPGAEIRVRRSGERKTRREARSDRRGEFAVRLPRGAEYEMSVAAKGYQEQTRKLDTRAGNRQDLVFRLAPASGGKPK